MRISVIIPCFNAERYLQTCLESVLNQSVTDIEVIVVDDGSTDGTYELACRMQARDARICVIHQKNAGVSAARNRALDIAHGEWITFVDSDDILADGALEAMLGAAEPCVDLVVCAHETFDEKGHVQPFYPEGRWPELRGEKQRRAAALRLIEGDSVLNIMCNKLHRRALIEREGIRLQPGLRIAEDALFNLEAVLCGRGVRFVDRVTYRYREHSGSAMHTRAKSEFDVHMPWFVAMRALLEKRGCMERYYAAYFDSVVLRLYKDGGVMGVMRGFSPMAKPLLDVRGMDRSRMTIGGRLLLFLGESGLYPYVYPAIAPMQMVKRKLDALLNARRNRKGRAL